MANAANFDHDFLGHLLADKLLVVPKFQRRYSWQESQITEFWDDITRARVAGDSYFMGTVVLARADDTPKRMLIIDGQQRITTTAILYIAIRDRLSELGKVEPARSVAATHLADYVLAEETSVAKLELSPDDQNSYLEILSGSSIGKSKELVILAYRQLKGLVDKLAPDQDDYRNLISLSEYLDSQVQVLLAVASGLPEAYIIFETLNDRGADLTTADLLKNYLFSQAGQDAINFAQAAWTRLSAAFDKPEDFVKFLRYEYMSRNGQVTHRGLYKALQRDIVGPQGVRAYLKGAEAALGWFVALKEPDDPSWSSEPIEVKDSLLAFRRFRFEGSMPLLLAVFATWKHSQATKFVDTVAAWSLRAWAVGTIGGGVAEKAFADAAVAVTNGDAKSVGDVRPFMRDLVPDDATFRDAFAAQPPIDTIRAKYLLACLERQYRIDSGDTGEALPDWSSKSITVEHIYAKSSKRERFSTDDEFERFVALKDQPKNLTLLEKTLNGGAEDAEFNEKTSAYSGSAFELTKLLGAEESWSFEKAQKRGDFLADLAVRAWPR